MVLIDFFGKLSSLTKGTDEYALNQIAGHTVLLTLSVINVVYLFFIEGLGKRALQKNFLQKLAFLGALSQIGTCSSTIIRFNIQEAGNKSYTTPSTACAFIANTFNFIALGVILFHGCDNRKMKWRIFSVFIIGYATLGAYLEITTDKIYLLQMFLIPSPIFSIICHWYTSHALQKGTVTIDSAIISKEAAIRTFKVMAYILFICDVLALASGTNVLPLIVQGLVFCSVNIGTYYMDKMVGLYDKPVSREVESLLP